MEIYKLEAELDLTKEKGEMRVKMMGSPWDTLGYYLEAVGYLAKLSLGEDERAKTPEEMANYVKDYLLKAMADYEDVSFN